MIRNFSKYIIGLTCSVIGLAMGSCDDYLDTTNERIVPAHDELVNIEALQAATANLYAQPWYYFHKQRFIMLGDARANNILVSSSTLNETNAQATLNEEKQNASVQYSWASLYNVITQADYILNDYVPYCIENKITSEPGAYACAGEARFMQALAYWYLAMYWHDVPVVDDPVTVSAVAFPNRFEDVIQYAACCAEFAQKWLPTVPSTRGRVSKVSACALLSRIYNTAAAWAKGNHYTESFKNNVLDSYYAGDPDYVSSESLCEFYYSKAANAARQAISLAPGSGYGMMESYEDIFKVQNNNCKEVLFAIQSVAQSTSYGLANELQGMFCYDRCLSGNFGTTYSNWASYDMVLLSSMRGGLIRTRGNIMPHQMTYDYLFHEYDPGKDHVNDDDKEPVGTIWTVNRSSWNPLAIKKYVVGGKLATNNVATNGNSGFCTPMLRMSEVYLNLTEALMGLYGEEATSRSSVLDNINTVRRRAYSYEIAADTYPGDYKTINLDSILLERRLEFFCEGLYWTDIVRRSFMGENHLTRMVNYMNNKIADVENEPLMGCHRLYQYSYKADSDLNKVGVPTLKTDDVTGAYKYYQPSRECVHNVADEGYVHSRELGNGENLWTMIYPATEVMQDPNLQKAPVAYDFSNIIANKHLYLDN